MTDDAARDDTEIDSQVDSGRTDDGIRALERARTQALVARDLVVMDRLHAPEYELISPPGRVFSRERYFALVAAAPFYTAWEAGTMRVRRTAAMAVVRYAARLTFPSGKVMHCWHTDTWEKRGALWQAVWSQATQLPADHPLVRGDEAAQA